MRTAGFFPRARLRAWPAQAQVYGQPPGASRRALSPVAPLQLDRHPIERALDLHLAHPFQHLAADMAQQQPLAAQAMPLVRNARIADVEGRLGLEIAALADEQVGPLRVTHQVFVPAAVARIQQRPAARLDAVAERHVAFLVRHAERQQPHAVQRRGLAGVSFRELQGEGNRAARQFAVHRPVQRPHPLLGSARADDGQRPAPRSFVQIFEKQERQPAEMVAVQMADRHEVDLLRGDLQRLQCEQRRGPAVEQKPGVRGLHQIPALASAAVEERVARAEYRYAHDSSLNFLQDGGTT